MMAVSPDSMERHATPWIFPGLSRVEDGGPEAFCTFTSLPCFYHTFFHRYPSIGLFYALDACDEERDAMCKNEYTGIVSLIVYRY